MELCAKKRVDLAITEEVMDAIIDIKRPFYTCNGTFNAHEVIPHYLQDLV